MRGPRLVNRVRERRGLCRAVFGAVRGRATLTPGGHRGPILRWTMCGWSLGKRGFGVLVVLMAVTASLVARPPPQQPPPPAPQRAGGPPPPQAAAPPTRADIL